MLYNYRIVVVTPAGRRRYLELLIPQIIKLRPVVDEYRLWVNTVDNNDIEYMKSVEKEYPDFIKLEYLTIPHNGNFSICSFFKNCTDLKTIYVRFDDDIIFVDKIESFTKFIEFRINNPEYFLVYANILNNAVISHIHQRLGNFNLDKGITGYSCMDNIGWNNQEFAVNLHNTILKEPVDLSKYYFNKWILYFFERVSINCLAWLGSTFAEFNGNVDRDEEQWLSVDYPKSVNKMNIIFGNFVVVHYAFYPQRELVDKTDILNRYRNLII